MAERRVAIRPLDPSARAAANAAVQAETGGKPIFPNQDDLQKKWMDAYVAAGGQVKTVGLHGRSPGEACEKCKDKKLTLKLISLEFLSDHNLLKNDSADWMNHGAPYPPPDWTPANSNPITHSMNEKIKVKLVVTAEPDGTAESGKIHGRIGGETIFPPKIVRFSPGSRHEVMLESSRSVRKKVRRQSVSFTWQVKTDASYPNWTMLGRSKNEWYTTIAKPRDASESQYGVTLKRMRKAVELVAPMRTIDSHEIVHNLMKKLPYYVLKADPNVPSEYKHPGYFNSKGGAWAIADYIAYYAECQAIVRFVLKIIKQIGAPGDGKMVYIYAVPATPGVAEEDTESTPGGKALHKHPGYALVDQVVSSADIGRVYPPSHTRLPDGSISMGFNAFEACLKFTAPGPGGAGDKTYYYPGGTGGSREDTRQQVLDHSFSALVRFISAWYPNAADPNRVMGLKIVEIKKIY